MARQEKASNAATGNGTALDFEARLWQTVDALRYNRDVPRYKHFVLGVLFRRTGTSRTEVDRMDCWSRCGQAKFSIATRQLSKAR